MRFVTQAFVAVTTATEVGVATPSTGAGGGGGGGITGGLFPPGGSGAAADELPPHPAVSATNAMSNIAANSSREWRVSVETFDMSGVPRERIRRRTVSDGQNPRQLLHRR
jgi:hypothetical protein